MAQGAALRIGGLFPVLSSLEHRPVVPEAGWPDGLDFDPIVGDSAFARLLASARSLRVDAEDGVQVVEEADREGWCSALRCIAIDLASKGGRIELWDCSDLETLSS
jgi:hypothetical protein